MLRRDPFQDVQPLIRSVYAYVAYRIGDGPEAEDVTSETFERAIRYRKTYDARKGEPIAWLIGIARHCISDAMSRPAVSSQLEAIPARGDLEQDTIRRLTLRHAVAGLGESDRELIALRFGGGLSARQIAAVTGRGTNAIEVALHRALGRLREVLDGEPSDDRVRQSAL